MMQEVEVLKTIQELICSFFSEEQFTLSRGGVRLDDLEEIVYNIVEKGVLFMDVGRYYGIR